METEIDLAPDPIKFRDEVEKYEKSELRSIFYNLAVEKEADEDYTRNPAEHEFGKNLITPFQIILLGWNSRAYLGRGITIEDFEDELVTFLEENNDELLALRETNLLDIQFFDGIDPTKEGEQILQVFNSLVGNDGNSGVNRINSTGASKLLHFVNRDLFVMWDGYINGKNRAEDDAENKFRVGYHQKGRERHWNQHTAGDAYCYLTFLDEMQTMARNLISKTGAEEKIRHIDSKKPLPKLLDQYNYQTVTAPQTG